MGNAFGGEKKNPFDEVETSPFNDSETKSIGSRYREIDTFINSNEADSKMPPIVKTPLFHPTLFRLLREKGVLETFDTFVSFLGDAMRVNSSRTVEMFWELVYSGDESTCGKEQLLNFFQLLLSLMNPDEVGESSSEFTGINNVAKSLVSAVLLKDRCDILSSRESYEALQRWICIYGPCVSKVLESYLTQKCLPDEKNPSFFPFVAPVINVKSDVLPYGAIDLIPLSLSCDALQGHWKRLYSSSTDGLSFNRMVHHIMGYEGPICILIKPQGFTDSIFGAFTSGRWKESNRFYGSSDTFLFRVKPDFQIMRSRDRSNSNYQWLNMKSYGMPHGLGLGGSMDSFRLFISESFENCTAGESCLTFDGGNLLPEKKVSSSSNDYDGNVIGKNNFEIDFVEVWATGGEQYIQQGLKALAKDREIRDENIQRARKVDKAQFFNNAFDQEFLLSGTFSHRAQAADRQDCSTKPTATES